MQITINGIPLLPGQAKAVAIAMAKLETDLACREKTGDNQKDGASDALLKLTREVRELVKCGG